METSTFLAATRRRENGYNPWLLAAVAPSARPRAGTASGASVPDSTAATAKPLSPRDEEILKDVVREFIVRGAPVSSRTVAKDPRLGLSAATVRNTMADLEEAGYLLQPHTSAGRVPTEAGYHAYIDSLPGREGIAEEERRRIDRELPENSDGEELVERAGQMLSELTDQIGIVLTPAMGETVLREVSLVGLSEARVLCVVVSADGFVDHKIVQLEGAATREELVEASNYLNSTFAGMTLGEARERLLRRMAEERAQVDRLLGRTLAVAHQALADSDAHDVVVQGTSVVLTRPELADVERVRRLVDKFDDRARLVSLLNQLIDGRGVRVVIGDESDLTSDVDFSLVSRTYRAGNRSVGSVGVFGPSRMEYGKVIPLVDYLGERLSRALQSPGEAGSRL